MCLWDTANENSLHGFNLTWPLLLFCHHLASSSGCYLQTLQGRTFHGNTTTGVTFQQRVGLLKIYHKALRTLGFNKTQCSVLCKIRLIFHLFCPVFYFFLKFKQLLTILSLHSDYSYTLLINAVIYYYLTDLTSCYLFPILLGNLCFYFITFYRSVQNHVYRTRSLLSRTRVYS